jgi:hypothetical protein
MKNASANINVYKPVANDNVNDSLFLQDVQNNFENLTCIEEIKDMVNTNCSRMENADVIIINTDSNLSGNACELGILYGWKSVAKQIENIIDYGIKLNRTSDEIIDSIMHLAGKYENKIVYSYNENPHLSDCGVVLNKFIHGVALKISNQVSPFSHIVSSLKNLFGDGN